MTSLPGSTRTAWDNPEYARPTDYPASGRRAGVEVDAALSGELMDDAFWAALEDPLTVRELARMLRKSEGTILLHLQDGTIPGHFIGRSWIVFKGEVRAWLLTRRNTPTGEQVDADPFQDWPEEFRMDELTRFFGKTSQTIRRWLEHGEIPGYRINGRWVAYKAELREALTASLNQRPI